MEIRTNSPEETYALGEKIGAAVPAGTVFALLGDMGAGKTLLSQGIAKGLGINEHITSPTFTIVNAYDQGRLKLAHMDIYRLEGSDEIYEMGVCEYFNDEYVALVEWPSILGDLLPKKHITIELSPEYDQDFNEYRIVKMTAENYTENEENWLQNLL